MRVDVRLVVSSEGKEGFEPSRLVRQPWWAVAGPSGKSGTSFLRKKRDPVPFSPVMRVGKLQLRVAPDWGVEPRACESRLGGRLRPEWQRWLFFLEWGVRHRASVIRQDSSASEWRILLLCFLAMKVRLPITPLAPCGTRRDSNPHLLVRSYLVDVERWGSLESNQDLRVGAVWWSVAGPSGDA